MSTTQINSATFWLAIALGFTLCNPSPTLAGTVFYDDFSDGSVTNDVPLDRDGNPVVWTPLAGVDQGTGDASTGDYVLTTSSDIGAYISGSSHAELTNTSVRAEMQLTGVGAIAFLARGDREARTAYQGGISTATGNAYISYIQDETSHPLVAEPANVDVTSGNVVLQFDVIGETLSLFTWNAGEEMPAEPALQVNDSRFSSGVAAVLLDTDDGPGTGMFRYVHVADAPIPAVNGYSL